MKFLNNINLNGNEAQNLVLQNAGTAPATSTKAGGIYFDTNSGNNKIKFYNGTSWVELSVGAPGTWQPYDADLASIAGLAGTSGVLVKTAADTWALATTSSDLAGRLSDETGSGYLVFNTSPSFVTSVTTSSTSFDLFNTTATTINFGGAATTLNIGNASGTVTIAGNLTVNGTVTTISSTTITVDDKNLELGSVETPTDTTANGGGITLKGATDKTFNWVSSTSSWTSSENLDLASGKVLKINGTEVLSASQYTGNAATATTATTATNVTGGAAGSLVYQSGAATTTTLGLGTSGYVLTAGASAPQWTKKKYATTIGNNSALTFALTHGLSSTDVVVAVYEASGGAVVYPDITYTDVDTVTLDFSTAPTSNQYKVVILA